MSKVMLIIDGRKTDYAGMIADAERIREDSMTAPSAGMNVYVVVGLAEESDGKFTARAIELYADDSDDALEYAVVEFGNLEDSRVYGPYAPNPTKG